MARIAKPCCTGQKPLIGAIGGGSGAQESEYTIGGIATYATLFTLSAVTESTWPDHTVAPQLAAQSPSH